MDNWMEINFWTEEVTKVMSEKRNGPKKGTYELIDWKGFAYVLRRCIKSAATGWQSVAGQECYTALGPGPDHS